MTLRDRFPVDTLNGEKLLTCGMAHYMLYINNIWCAMNYIVRPISRAMNLAASECDCIEEAVSAMVGHLAGAIHSITIDPGT